MGKTAWFGVLLIALSFMGMTWRYLPNRDKRFAKRHASKIWWIPLMMLAILGGFIAFSSTFSLKLF